jgi:DNA-binding NtrC family response regulator
MCTKPKGFTILIADRNPRVRDFLKREMIKEGYRVHLAESAGELLSGALHLDPLDLIIVDPDFPGAAAPVLLHGLQSRFPPVPIVVHTHYVNAGIEPAASASGLCRVVEKGGSSVERLKQVASEMINHHRPDQTESARMP